MVRLNLRFFFHFKHWTSTKLGLWVNKTCRTGLILIHIAAT
jgi:hypothetical protein